MNELTQTFNFGLNGVRTATSETGDVYFCLPDVANILELGNANASRFQLDAKGVHKMCTPSNGGVHKMCTPTNGGRHIWLMLFAV